MQQCGRYKSPRNIKARKYMEDCSRFEDLKKTNPKLVVAKTKNQPHLYPQGPQGSMT